MMTTASRYTILKTFAICVFISACGNGGPTAFQSAWHDCPDRRWIGPDFWVNRLQDWWLRDGRLEATTPWPMRTAHLVTRQLIDRTGNIEVSAHFGPLLQTDSDSGRSSAGVLIGAGRGLDYRAAALIHHSYGPSAGLYIGVDTDGRLFVRDIEQEDPIVTMTETRRGPVDSVALHVSAQPLGDSYEIVVRAVLWNAGRDTIRLTTGGIPEDRLVGNVALVSDTRSETQLRFWFSNWSVSGTKIERFDERRAGPVLGTQHTLSRGTLKLTAQLMPIGVTDRHRATLQIKQGRSWVTVAEAPVSTPSYTATFRVENWDDQRDTPYRVVYVLVDDGVTEVPHYYEGTVRKDPAGKDEIVVAAFTGNHNVQGGVNRAWFPWDSGVWFPHADIVQHVEAHGPDFLFFSGDQVYEGASPTSADFLQPMEDYLYKWYLWVWAFRDLTAEIPSVTIPDDHDVFHGNVWGAGGKATPRGLSGSAAQDAGGYKLPAEFVNMVEQTQTSHLPDPFDPTPVQQGIGVYYTDVLYAGVSFAVVEDRKFKSAPGPLLPQARVRNGWYQNPAFDPKTQSDAPGAELLGPRQEAFLEHWASDWSGGAWMKVLLSQTLFSNIATIPDSASSGSVIPSLPVLEVGEYADGDKIVSDMDSNGWPQSGRDRAVRVMRKGFAVHLAGDQHLGSTVQYGIDDWNDASYALCVPSVANFWPRRWFPPYPGNNRDPNQPRYTGEYEDGFGNKMTVHAVSNPHQSGKAPARLHDRAPGYGIARFDRSTRQVSLENWPRWADPDAGDSPYPGWPVVFDQQDNYGKEALGYLPTIEVVGMPDPVVQVVLDDSDEIVYTLRISGTSFTPKVYESGTYTVHVGEPGTDQWTSLPGLQVTAEPADAQRIEF
jgi:hypothetical protein